ncbi:MAG: hypothetical protein M3345_00830 [Actinomycetota bacterium]|nr:hypothetical protein [Actinomycetota bacterium]
MDKRQKVIAAVVAGLALAGIGTGVVLANSGDDDKPLKGTSYDKATAAAVEHVGGGTVIETEVGDDGAAYGVEIRKGDGSVVEVNLDESFNVIGSEVDDDGPNDADDEGEGEEGADD